MSQQRNFCDPIEMPASAFEEIEPITNADGKVLRRFRLKGTGIIGRQVPMDGPMFSSEVVEIKPMPLPDLDALLGFSYGDDEGASKKEAP